MIIAIDGPAGVGKSTLARKLAAELEISLLDTGAMYRAVALAVDQRQIDPLNAQACGAVARTIKLGYGRHGELRLDGLPAEPAIRSQRIDEIVSQVSAHPEVRQAMVPIQRARAGEVGLVAEGRDIGSVVFPDADFKFFLTASAAERARRRAAQMGCPDEVLDIEAELVRRDQYDSNRPDSPLVRTQDAVVIDTEGMSPGEVLDCMLEIVEGEAGE